MNLVWALLLVTYGANVTYAELPGKAACEQARSLTLYGQTVEEKAEADAKAKEEAKKRHEAFVSAHPNECKTDPFCDYNISGLFISTSGVIDNSNDIKYARCVLLPKEE